MRQARVRTDWLGVLLSLLVPAAVVSGLVWAALVPVSWADTPGWAWGLFMLFPLEGVRTWVTGVASNAYEEYQGPWKATMSLLGAIVTGVCFVLIVMFVPGRHTEGISIHDLAAGLSDPWVWQVILAPIALIVATSAIGLLLFRGNVRVEAARAGAIAATTEFWFICAFVCIAASGFVFAFVLMFGPAWIVDLVFEKLRAAVMLFAAVYFAGKAVLLAYLHTAWFMRSGRCPIPRERQDVVGERRDALLGQDLTLRELLDQGREEAEHEQL